MQRWLWSALWLGGLACGGAGAPVDTGVTVDAGVHMDAGRDAGTEPPLMLEPLPAAGAIAGPLTLEAGAYGARPFLSPAALEDVLQSRYSLGREFFVATWVPAVSSTRPNLDGLGPLFHAESCVACHPATGRPRSLREDGTTDLGLLVRLRGEGGPDPVYGGQLQPRAIAGHRAEGAVFVSFDGGVPRFSFELDPLLGPLAPTTHALPRLSPHLTGLGLLEALSDAQLLAAEDPDDHDGDGVSGRAARLPQDGGVGRFGWKALQPTIAGQSAAAFAGDMGLTSPTHADDCTQAQRGCLDAPSGGAPEVSTADVDAVSTFLQLLGVPAARRAEVDSPLFSRGHQLFFTVGCAACHRPTWTTPPDGLVVPLRGVTFHPYTDLLLHDLGPGLGEPVGEGVATGAEWRTPPLWGLGLVEQDPDARFLHDGRAATLEAAIDWHQGEANAARARFQALAPADHEALLQYLRSL